MGKYMERILTAVTVREEYKIDLLFFVLHYFYMYLCYSMGTATNKPLYN